MFKEKGSWSDIGHILFQKKSVLVSGGYEGLKPEYQFHM